MFSLFTTMLKYWIIYSFVFAFESIPKSFENLHLIKKRVFFICLSTGVMMICFQDDIINKCAFKNLLQAPGLHRFNHFATCAILRFTTQTQIILFNDLDDNTILWCYSLLRVGFINKKTIYLGNNYKKKKKKISGKY